MPLSAVKTNLSIFYYSVLGGNFLPLCQQNDEYPVCRRSNAATVPKIKKPLNAEQRGAKNPAEYC